MASGFPNEAQKSKVKGWQWSLAMFIPGSNKSGVADPLSSFWGRKGRRRQTRIGSPMLVQGQRSAMFLRLDTSVVLLSFNQVRMVE